MDLTFLKDYHKRRRPNSFLLWDSYGGRTRHPSLFLRISLTALVAKCYNRRGVGWLVARVCPRRDARRQVPQ
ncbi:hypothetical protein DVH24_008395 [Malus domestica]|uniref:Uncharacterized protein n=1 Tax=Malus domestica TaxID=3750 RepID=A0A498JLF1_MALDO|nr:hypothetical protein DVH24_008395 [Malus domestica]